MARGNIDRRTMLGLVGSTGLTAVAGCSAPADPDGSGGGGGGTSTSDAGGGGGGTERTYEWADATWDAYWYSLYNMSTNIAMSGNGVLFPHNEEQQAAFDQRVPAMLEHSDTDKPPIKSPNLNMAAFTAGDPSFTQRPAFDAGDGRPDASTLVWDESKSSGVVSPSSLAWTHQKGVTWAKNFEKHFSILPPSLAAKFRAQMLTTLAQIGVNATLIAGGPEGNGALTKGDSLRLVSAFRPATGEVVDDTTRPHHHSAYLWFLSNLNSLAQGGWYGYVNPEPLIPAGKIQQLTDGMAKTTVEAFDPGTIVEMASTRSLGEMLAAIGYYGTQAGSGEMRSVAADYADALASTLADATDGDGRVANGAANQAATQGIAGQGLVWASQIDGVDHLDAAESVLTYLLEDLWTPDPGMFAAGTDATTHTMTARDVGDVTGGLNAADAVLDRSGVKSQFASYFDQVMNRGKLQRAQRPNSVNEGAAFQPPLPPEAGGEFGQAAVYNGELEYDADADTWRVTDGRFYTADALYLANQDIWVGRWAGDEYQGRGIPGESDQPPQES